MIGGAAKGFMYGAGLAGAGIGGMALWGRYGGRASAFGKRITKAINPMRGLHVM